MICPTPVCVSRSMLFLTGRSKQAEYNGQHQVICGAIQAELSTRGIAQCQTGIAGGRRRNPITD